MKTSRVREPRWFGWRLAIAAHAGWSTRTTAILALAVLYFLTGRLGLLLAMPGGHVTPVWPPSGIALAAVLLLGRRVWPGIWLGSFAANLWDFYGSPLSLFAEIGTSAVFGVGASLTALIGERLLQQFVGERGLLARVRDVCAFMALGGVFSCLLSATVGATTLCGAGFAPWAGYGQIWTTWWLGDMAGVFVLTPFVLVWSRRQIVSDLRIPAATIWMPRYLEAVICSGLLIGVTYFVFIEHRTWPFSGRPFTFAIIPFLVWPAVRFGVRGATAAGVVITALAVWGTMHGSGPFSVGPRNESLLLLNMFLGVVVLTALCIAAIATERAHAEAEQRRALEETEGRVNARTAELLDANRVLESEIAERQRAQAQETALLAESERAHAVLLSLLEDEQRADAERREVEKRSNFALKKSRTGAWELDLVDHRARRSPEHDRIFGYELLLPEWTYEMFLEHVLPEDRAEVDRLFREACATQSDWSFECRIRRCDGEVRWILGAGEHRLDAVGQARTMAGIVQDVTEFMASKRALETTIRELASSNAELEHITQYDALTGLPNRSLVADRLQQAMSHALRRNRSVAVAFLDLDSFKAVNDQHGHGIGDELLIGVSKHMKATMRDGDTLARIGGDEFVALMVDLAQAQDCEPGLARLLRAATAPVVAGDHVLSVSASIGVTLFPQDSADADQLMRHADQAMYAAKQAGKNCYHLFDVALDTAVKTQRESLENIRNALERREFVMFYQPKVNMKTSEVIGAEALIRWQHPQRGVLSPSFFLPIIEDDPLSVKMGEWVIDAVLTQIAAWQAAGLGIAISVNVGARQLQQDGFVSRIAALLAAHPAVRPTQLELEILETSALEDVAQVSAIMLACRKLGVTFALDDFGTGYSSLTYLKRLPVEVLKIDQSFVRNMLDDPDDLAIVEGVIGLATAFGRVVIAEGVETIAHGEALLKLGCDLAQGYAIARPMPAAELPGWVASWRPPASWTV